MDNHTENATDHTFFNNGTNGTYQGFAPPPPKGFWSGLILPLAYLVILIGSLYSFSTVYRQRQIARAAKLEPWFSAHTTRNIYLSLLHLDPAEASEGDEKQLKKVPDSVLKAALLKRAVEDIQRIVQLRQSKPALQTLLQRGSVGDELWQRFQRAEQEMELEVKDVVNEANAFAPNWGQTIFQSANEINQNIILKQRTAEIQSQLEAEKAWWEQKREGIRSGFMAELEGAQAPTSSAVGPNSKATEAVQRTAKTGSSDDDAVLVEANGPEQPQGAQGGKKKKGKK